MKLKLKTKHKTIFLYQVQRLAQVIDSGCSGHGRDAERQLRSGFRVAVVPVLALPGSRVLNDPIEPAERAAVEQRRLSIRIPDPGED